jgi:antitoxin component YwqK of YwqJK toxin-antitoxin module
MKPLILILSIFFTLTAFGQQPEYPDSGFTHKAEAKNLMVNGLKEGKWIEYLDNNKHIIKTGEAHYYRLIVYKAGKPRGIVREYAGSIDGKGCLVLEVPYSNDTINGVRKSYYNDGIVESEAIYLNGKINGMESRYYTSGKILSETPYANGKLNGTAKNYHDNGVVESEIPFTNGKIDGMIKYYDESGILTRTESYVRGNFRMGTRKYYDKNGNEIK